MQAVASRAGDSNALRHFPPLTGRPDELSRLISDVPETKVWALEPGKPVRW